MIKLIQNTISEKQLEWRNDPKVMKTCRQNRPLNKDEHENWFDRAKVDPSIALFGIDVDGVLVGYGMLSRIDFRHKTAEYSLLIGPEYQGNGYAKEGLKQLLNYGFQTLNLFKIYGDILDGNDASIHIAAGLGFENEGYLMQEYEKEGQRVGATHVAIFQRDWKIIYG